MALPKRIFLIGDFKLHSPMAVNIERRHWIKGLIRSGCDVQPFSYRNMVRQFSPFQRKSYALRFGRKKTEQALLGQMKAYLPDVVMILSMEDIRVEFLQMLRDRFAATVFVGRDVDWHPDRNPERMAIAKLMHIVVATNGGSWLQSYKEAGVPLCAFIPCPCDPDIQRPYEKDPSLQTDIFFTGKINHGKHSTDNDRQIILNRLLNMSNVRVCGHHRSEKIEGVNVFRAISNAKIALSINAVNNQRLCHSDRFINCISCGTFTLAKNVPDSELLFRDGVEVKYFADPEEFFELADYFLKNESERLKIAEEGMKKAHQEFSCTVIAKHVLDLIETGSYNAAWKYVL